MFAADGDLKLVDFGLSKLRGGPQITQAGVRLGTPLYMSPEQAQGQDIDERSDIFSLGVVMFEMAAGRPPFVSDKPEGIVYQIIHTPVPSLRASDPSFPSEPDTIIHRALEKNPGERYHRMLDLAAGLRSFVDNSPGADQLPTESLSAPLPPPRPIWKRWPWVLAAVLVIALASVLALRPVIEKYRRNAAATEFYEQGSVLLNRFYLAGNIDKSISAFGKAIQSDPAFTEAYAALSQAFWQKYLGTRDRQFLDQARTNADKALGLDGSSVSAHVASGAVLNASGDRENAIAEFRRALSKDPANVEALRELASAYDAAGNLMEAETLFNKAAKLRPGDWYIWSEFGVFHYRHQKYVQAEKDFRTVISLAPDYPAAHRNLGAVAMALNQFADAEREFLASASLEPSGSNYSNLGAMYIYQGRYRDAIDVMEKAIQLTPAGDRNLYILWANLADAYRYTPKESAKAPAAFRRAIEEVEKRLAFAPNDPNLLSAAAVFRAKVGERSPALDEIGRAIGFAHGNRYVSFNAALVYELTGARDRALVALEDAIHGGYSLNEIERDPALAELRRDSRYQKLVASSK